MTDDGSFSGHGPKPGRRASVISMSAHKNRHNKASSDDLKPVANLTLFDFVPGDNYDLDSAQGEITSLLGGALPCEDSPFERDVATYSTGKSRRRFMRWGADENPTESGDDGANENPPQSIDENCYISDAESDALEVIKKREKRANRHKKDWQHKTGRSGSVPESFYHAINGLKSGFATERNVRVHCGIAGTVALLALLLKVDTVGCLALTLATGFVFFAEYMNTALEHITNIQTNFRFHKSARLAKDTSAAAVMLAAFTASVVGAIVFLPRFAILLSGGVL